MLRQRNFTTQLPSRLTKLYSDTKISCNVVSGHSNVEDVPELLALHRKYRIQKDRLMTWGLEWTDGGDIKAAAQGNIDQSIARAGLTETVTSVLGNIKDVLDEAEQISRRSSAARKPSEKGWAEGAGERTWALADKSRYEDLVKDLTTSIDVLYDLSHARRASQASTLVELPLKKDREASAISLGVPQFHFKSPFASTFNTSELTLVNTHATSTTAATAVSPVDAVARWNESGGLPPKIELDSLILPHEEPPPYPGENIGLTPPVRLVGQHKRRHSSTNPWKTDGGREITEPVLVEYAAFDPIYRDTGVPPPLQRLELINRLLQTFKASRSQAAGTLPLIGYFEDANHSRIGIVYHIPDSYATNPSEQGVPGLNERQSDRRPASLLSLLQLGQNKGNAPVKMLFQPTLEDRFRLAFNVASSLRQMHEKDVIHGDVNSASFIFFQGGQQRVDRSVPYDIRAPYVTSFDIFSDYSVDAPPARSWSPRNIYLHPEGTSKDARTDIDPRTRLDMYGLGLILLEIGLWTPLIELFKSKYTLGEFKLRLENIWAKRLASKCGSLYMKCVLDCLSAGDDSPLTKIATHELHLRILKRLTRCCALDEEEPVAGPTHPISPLQHAVTHDGVVSHTRHSSEQDQRRPAVFPRTSGSHGGEKHDWNPLHKLRHPAETMHRHHTVSSITNAASALPLAYAGIASPAISQEPADMTSERVEELQKELAQKEVAIQDLRRSYDAVMRNVEAEKGSASAFELGRSQSLNELEAHLRSRSTEMVHGAAKTIQSAWRNRRTSQQPNTQPRRSFFAEYQSKVTLIQRYWRERQARESEASTEHDQTREVYSDAIENQAQAPSEPSQNILGGLTTEEPEVEQVPMQPSAESELVTEFFPRAQPREKKKLKVYPVKLSPALLNDWHQRTGPQLMRIVERALKDSPETSSIDLLGIGDDQWTAKPTIFITCTSVGRVKAAINRKFEYDKDVFDVKVRKGKIRRSSARRRVPPAHRSMMNSSEDESQVRAANPYYFERPLSGASIGAFKGEHLPPVSYGGVVVVDGKPYGMSVHHILEEQSEAESEYDEYEQDNSYDAPVRSSAPYGEDDHLAHIGSAPSLLEVPEEVHPMEISDYSSEEEDAEGYYSDGSDDSSIDPLDMPPPRAPSLTNSMSTSSECELDNIGDTPGVSPDDPTRIPITQPALDDVPPAFFPSRKERDDEHLLSHKLGYVYASSGMRRVPDPHVQDMRHEVDWALFQLDPPRLQPYNVIQGGRRLYDGTKNSGECAEPKPTLVDPVTRSGDYEAKEDLYPMQICSASEVAGQKVFSFGRTSGLKLGRLSEARGSVKILGRKTFSWAWSVVGDLGVAGDSGAWVVETNSGKVCGHVLAYSKAKGVAYICPMDILFDDIKRTLGADRIGLPSANEPELVDMAEHGRAEELNIDELPHNHELDDTEAGASEADVSEGGDDLEDAMWSNDDEGTAISDNHTMDAQLSNARSTIRHEGTGRRRRNLRIDTPSAGELGVQLQGLGITTESPPRRGEQVLAHHMTPPMDRGSAFMPQMIRSPISGEPIH
ncbi:MAG: hypothetical protein M1821_003030 [Bathelium mastoideum]|nr:MAG: hypothetical protein M1821_003030 [Bathelium mastoideum]KAI9681920.1 MAG: hypothetical protein M1822_006997 [Bathelium mastoideum]